MISTTSKKVQDIVHAAHVPKIKNTPVFNALINDYAKYKKENLDNLPFPETPAYMPHRVAVYRLWDKEYKKMDYGVLLSGNKVLIPASAGEDTSSWHSFETAVIAGVYYFIMPLDNMFIVMENSFARDKKGQELYDGDIVEDSDKEHYYVVYDRYNKRWILSTTTPEAWQCATLSISILYAAVTTKIGNIFVDTI
jgi:hypothetical protein